MPKSTKKNITNVKRLMVQGTSSHVGKSILTAAILRIIKDLGVKAAPFKAQNMALNSFVTPEGGEIGRAQAFQAEAAGVLPAADMNPILLKPTADSTAQVIIQGKVFGNMSAREYHGFKKEAKRFVLESYSRLAEAYDFIVIEGAGSPAEINLREDDIANMGVAELTDSPVVLVGDIDRGGVFASLVGTLELLTEEEKNRVKGFIINKFRGDISLLRPGLDFLSNKTKRPVFGVVPYLKDIILPDEDGVSLEGIKGRSGDIAISVIKLPRISNFTDFDPFRFEPSVRLDYIETPEAIKASDIVIIPGTKNTIEDLLWLKAKGFIAALKDFHKKGGHIIGICGGFQIMGRTIEDPYGVESGIKSVEGLSLFDTRTILTKEKNTFQVEAEASGHSVKGYEIHMGETSGEVKPFSVLRKRNGKEIQLAEGGISEDKRLWGTYIHGIFDNDSFRKTIIDSLRKKKGLSSGAANDFKALRERSFIELADRVKESVDIERLLEIAGK